MALQIRKAEAGDVPAWIELQKTALGPDYSDPRAADPAWVATQFGPESAVETWVATSDGLLLASVSFLPPRPDNANLVANLGRCLIRPEAYENGIAEQLLREMFQLAAQRRQIVITRVLASDSPAQQLHESLGAVCVGFQPFKHLIRVREGILFYLHLGPIDLSARLPISESLPQVTELVTEVLTRFNLPAPGSLRDGAVGYPLQREIEIAPVSFDEFRERVHESQSRCAPKEVSGTFNMGFGYLRTDADQAPQAFIGRINGETVAGLSYSFDPIDRACRITEAFASDDLSLGALFSHLQQFAHQELSAVSIEVDLLMSAPRLIKSAEQLGFVPVAYFPGIFLKDDTRMDVVKMVKLNMVYSVESPPGTTMSRAVAEIIDHNFEDQKIGVAIINLLRGLPIFEGLGDGELRKFARLFTQKLFRPGERIFSKGDLGNEAYVVMRGQIDILLDEGAAPIASIGNGQVFGELAFLDAAARSALAVATQPSILLVIQRSAFNTLTQKEPHLGMVVVRNIALELANRLRRSNAALSSQRK